MGRIKWPLLRLGSQRSQVAIRMLFLMFFCLLLSSVTMRRLYMNSGTMRSRLGPGIGFDLTTSYGTAVIRNYDGSFVNVAQVQIDPEYKEMMQRLSLQSSKHPSPPYNSLREVFRDEHRQILRFIRKRLGFPASKDVRLLSELIQQLRKKTEMKLGHSIDSVVVSFSPNVALYEEDINDSIEFAGLEPLTERTFRLQPRELSAALGGTGLGLCKNYYDIEKCMKEEEGLPYEQVLAVSYTRDALEVSLAATRIAYDPYEPDNHHLIDWDAGESSLARYSRADAYWVVVRRRILELSYMEYPKKKITAVLLLGERAHNKEFQRALVDALREFQDDLPIIHQADPLYLAAKGAAEYAKRANEQMTYVRMQEALLAVNGVSPKVEYLAHFLDDEDEIHSLLLEAVGLIPQLAHSSPGISDQSFVSGERPWRR